MKYRRIVTAFIALAFATTLAATIFAADASPPAAGYKERLQDLARQDKDAEEFALAQVGAAAGDKDAEFTLGNLYNWGSGHKSDMKKAVFWYRKAAEQGLVDAQNELGLEFGLGYSVPEDQAESFKWYSQSAAQNDTTGLYNLALFYDSGVYVERNYDKAVALLRRAANLGDKHSKDYLEHSMASGPRIPAGPAHQQIVSCRTSCVNGACSRIYDDGRRVRFQAQQKFNALSNTWEWDPGTC
jgi:TPR repeat protein